ncbi:MAG: polyprenol monophosphomannose synthase [Candidatus Tectomicrobia bacterium]|nr:polyprenol monophosphomannose synthase [Candidatus Tectomicrobia bacterium]
MLYADTLVILPTYNEATNIRPLIEAIQGFLPGVQVLVVDDDSPDGTADVVRRHCQGEAVRLLLRTSDRGRGRAGIAGFRWSVERAFPYVVEMDADFSHHPRHLPALVTPVRRGELDVAIGSRQVEGGGERGRSPIRQMVTKLANAYVRGVMSLPVRDCTSGYRCFRHEVLAAIPWDCLTSVGPSVVEEVLHLVARLGFRIGEVPILFEERRQGSSQLTLRKLLDTAVKVVEFRLRAESKLARHRRQRLQGTSTE